MGYVTTHLKREFTIDSIVTIHYFEYSADVDFRGESHNFWELLYVDRGKLFVPAGNADCILSAGEVIFHEPMEFHAFHSISDRPPNLVVMSFLCDSPFLDFFRHGVFRLTVGEQMTISQIIEAANLCFSTPLNVPTIERVAFRSNQVRGYSHLIALYLEQLLLTIYQHRQALSFPEQSAFTVNVDERTPRENFIAKIIQYMEAHLTEKVTLQELCAVFALSSSTLEAAFKKEKKYSPITYFSRMKIDKAKELLREGNMNITEIAYYLSFSSLQHFSREFKKSTGFTPKEYQSSVKEISRGFRGSSPVHRVFNNDNGNISR